MGVEQLDELGEVGQRAGEPVDLVDDDDSIFRDSDVVEQLCRAGRSIEPPEKPPSSKRSLISFQPSWRLALDVGFARLALRIERVEVLLEAGDRRADRSRRGRPARAAGR